MRAAEQGGQKGGAVEAFVGGSDPDPDARQMGGRGLLLVEGLGKDWGAYRKASGKVVWVLIDA